MGNVTRRKPKVNRPSIQCLAHACHCWLRGGVITLDRAIEHYTEDCRLTPAEAEQLRKLVESAEKVGAAAPQTEGGGVDGLTPATSHPTRKEEP